jgi:hypothetical protein
LSHYFYIPGKRWAEDGAVLVDDVWCGLWSPHKTLADYPAGTVILTDEEVSSRVEAICITQPKEVDADRYQYLLEVLPPLGWRGLGSGAESFKLSEFTSGRVTCVMVRIGARYFEFEDVFSKSHDDCVKKVTDWLAAS